MIRLKGVLLEDFCNYQKPSMFLITCFCNWKCCLEQNLDKSVCQNEPVYRQPIKEFTEEQIYKAYIKNDITKAIVIGGLEPLLQEEEIYNLIKYFRDNGCNDEFVIYTGYTEEEVLEKYTKILSFNNIIFKFGRYIPNNKSHFDNVLGIELVSDNQYGKKFNF